MSDDTDHIVVNGRRITYDDFQDRASSIGGDSPLAAGRRALAELVKEAIVDDA